MNIETTPGTMLPEPPTEAPEADGAPKVWHGFWATTSDRKVLVALCKAQGDATFSAVLRRLIREEAHRLNIAV